MLNVSLNQETRIVLLEPHGEMTKQDFVAVAEQIDPFIEASGALNGLIIHTEKFPGWDSFAALVAHLKFVRDHHKEIRRVALVTDSAMGDVAEGIGRHFIAAKVVHFAFDGLDQAISWILD